jgi:hypothetical protein
MKKTKTPAKDTATGRKEKRLALRTEVLRHLDPEALRIVQGGIGCQATVKPPP